ncbi:MAG TPA: AAA family ATPase [Pseudonocardiaceae bacterium]|nr:AAA family ATPase [Pseudonocardiaceae bacterium]
MSRTAPDSSFRVGWPFVGREDELGLVLAQLTGPAELVGVEGEPGVGKTRLLRAAANRLNRSGWDVIWLAGSQAIATVPLAALGPILAQPGALPAGPATTGAASADAFAAGAAAILMRTRGARVVMVLDDADLLDPVSAALVEWASNDTEASVALAARAGSSLPQPLARLRQERPDAWVELAGLDRDEVAEVLGTALDGPVAGVTVEYVWQTTGGNALFVRELVAAGWRSGALRPVHGVWCWDRSAALPPSLAGLVAERLAAVTPAARDALEIVAFGEPLPVSVLGRLASAEAIAELERGGWLAVDPAGSAADPAGVVRLAHPMVGEAVRAGVGPLRAKQVHARLAGALLSAPQALADGELRSAVWAVAGDVDVRPELLVRAGWEALYRYDLRLAERLAERAGGGWPADRLLAGVRHRQRRPDQVDGLLAGASDRARTPEQRVRSAVLAAETLYWVQADLERAATVLSEVGADPAGLAMQATLALFDGRPGDALRIAGTALAGPVDQQHVRLWLLTTATFAAACAGRYQQAIELADEGIALARPVGSSSPWGPNQLGWARCAALGGLGRLDEAAAIAEEGYAEGVRLRLPELAGGWSGFAGLIARIRGRLPQSTQYYREAAALLGEHDPFRLGSLSLIETAIALAQQGEPGPAQQALKTAQEQLGDGVNRAAGAWIAQARAWIAYGNHQPALATRLLMHAANVAESTGGHGTAMIALHTVARFGAPQLVRDRLRRLTTVVDGPLVRLFALHAAALCDADGGALDSVAAGYASVGAPLLAAEAARSAATAHRRAGHAGSALVSASRADGWLADCGNAYTPTLPAASPSPLTGRERDVVGLAAAGWASRRIAEHLGLSVRTVDNHLGRAYRKLGVTGRRSIAAESDGPFPADPNRDAFERSN